MLDLVSKTYLSNELLHSLSEALQRKKSDENNTNAITEQLNLIS